MKQTLKKVLDLIYPPRCPLCQDIVQPGSSFVCEKCREQLPWVRGTVCDHCGKPVEEEESLCPDCVEMEYAFDQGRAVFLYDDKMRKSIQNFKYKGRREYVGFYGICAWIKEKDTLLRWAPDMVVPVPLHKSRLKKRGYNQACLFAKEIAGYLNIPVEQGCIKRAKNTHPLKDQSPDERMESLKDAFVPGPTEVKNKKILLVDDIYTTGSTANAVSSVLKSRGALEIYLLSVCIGKGFMIQ